MNYNLTAITQSRRLSTFWHIARMADDADAKMILTAPASDKTSGTDHQGSRPGPEPSSVEADV